MHIRKCTKCGKFIRSNGIPIGGTYYHKECLVCTYCGMPLDGSFVTFRGNIYHPECVPSSRKLICAFCRKPISEAYYSLNGRNFHEACYHNNIEKNCIVCGKPIGSEIYTKDDWGHFAHVMHGVEKTRSCYACGRIISGPCKQIGPDAVLCCICSETAVTSERQVESCRKRVLDIFDSLGITDIPRNIPIELKPQAEMKQRLGFNRHYVTRHLSRADFRICIIQGLPALFFQGVLAHEMLHSWLTLFGREVTQDESEGFCNLGEAFIYTKDDSPYAHYLLKRMYENADAIYGDGYRLQKERYEKLGWAGLLSSLRAK